MQRKLQTEGLTALLHLNPASTRQVEEQPSLFKLLPSSQYSPGLVILSPHFVQTLLNKMKSELHSVQIGFNENGSIPVHFKQFVSSQ